MDINIPETLLQKHPGLVPMLQAVIRREESEECLRVVTRAGGPFNTVQFDLGGRIDVQSLTSCDLPDPQTVSILWLDEEQTKRGGIELLESLSISNPGVERWAVFIVGKMDEGGVEDFRIRLFMKYRVNSVAFNDLQESVEELYRWSINLNAFYVLFPGHGLETSYIARVMMLLNRDSAKVPLARRIARMWNDDWKENGVPEE
ncbi:hypothetical protein V5O48_003881 [Marasmius crinis-equi]|uniref:Uncharacterized protein n=1 Tax=Marasmius crinis-equi TaxID=585013 RepID=A0ABR3FRU5_9AGAR